MDHAVSKNRVPLEAFWDQGDKRLLAVETEFIKDLGKGSTLENTLGDGQIPKGLDNIKLEEIENDFKKQKVSEDEFQGKTIETYFVTSDFKVKR